MPKTSLFHIAKRDALPWYQATLIRGCAILLALVVCALVTMLMTGENPFSIYATIFKGAFGTARKTWVTFQNLAVLLGISLAVTPAFKMRFWNIGAEGQVLIGCLATAACMICLGDKIPNALLILISLLAALVAGGIWGLLPAFFKAKWNTNETLFTLMMNYIATQLSAFFIIVWEVPKGAGKIGIINQNSEAGWLPVIGGQKYLLIILVVAILTVLMYIYLNYSKHGYEIAVVGESQRTASYAGIKVERVIIRTMLLSGAVCGLMGLQVTAARSPAAGPVPAAARRPSRGWPCGAAAPEFPAAGGGGHKFPPAGRQAPPPAGCGPPHSAPAPSAAAFRHMPCCPSLTRISTHRRSPGPAPCLPWACPRAERPPAYVVPPRATASEYRCSTPTSARGT